MIGTKLAHYEITSHIGSGGMGDVYRATDTKLGRSVAIKVLPPAFASDADRLSRFRREAQLLASLNHSNIAHIYGLEEAGDARCIVMELVEGETLQARIQRGSIPLDEALGIARQIADALEAAHERGVVHRDLKPGNVMLANDDMVKVLDFGLAKAYEANSSNPASSHSPTVVSMPATNAGMILGTAAYMSPEQARGKAVDKRTDIWAFGVVLYELLTGERPFRGVDTHDILINILTQKPDLQRIPPKARRLIAKCLEKDPKHRLRDLGDAWDLLDEAETYSSPPSLTRLTTVLGVVTLVLVIALSVLSFLYFRQPTEQEGTLRYSIAAPEGASSIHSFAISPNGRTLVIAATVNGKRQLWIRPMDAGQASPLPSTEDATYPFWSPDNNSIGFFAQGRLKNVAASGGPAESLCPVPDARGGSWNRDGVIVFASSLGGRVSIQRIHASGGTPSDLLATPGDYTNPTFLPDGRHFLFVNRQGEQSGVYISSVEGKEIRRILSDVSSVVYAAPSRRSTDRVGRLLFVRDNSLMAQPFDAGSAQLLTEPSTVAKGVSLTANNIYAPVTASETGVLLYYNNESAEYVMHWFDRNGQVHEQIASEGDQQPSLSPDGKAVVFSRGARLGALWVRDLNRGTDQILTTGNEGYGSPVWSRSGDRIVYGMLKNGVVDLYGKLVLLSAPNELLVTSAYSKAPTQLSKEVLVYQEFNPKTKRDIWIMRMQAGATRKPEPFLQTPSDELFAQLSPDSRWMAYTSDVSGRREVWVRSFPAADRETLISTNGGEQSRWRSDGKELFFAAGDGKLTAVNVNTQGDMFTAGPPRPLFDMRLAQTENGAQFQYDVSADGNRFLITTRGTATTAPLLSVIVNWPEGSSSR
jgi:serine/threonine protein kinase/dipeptidyl aminopeptidase/acylaminoacyl peptidase